MTKGVTYATFRKKYAKIDHWPEHVIVVSCLWEDAAHSEDHEDASTMFSFISGTVVEATPKHLKLAMEVFPDKSARDVTTIPSTLIRKIIPWGSLKL